MARVLLSVLLALCFAAPALAQEPGFGKGVEGEELAEGLVLPATAGLHETRFSGGRVTFEVHARPGVDVRALVRGAGKADDAATIYSKFNEARKRLYPDEEIVLSIGPDRTSDKGKLVPATSLVRSIYWWNNYNGNGKSWWAQYDSSAATLFIDDVSGRYDIYDRYAAGDWVKRATVSAGGGFGRAVYGVYAFRGFKGLSRSSSRADIVMYFFR